MEFDLTDEPAVRGRTTKRWRFPEIVTEDEEGTVLSPFRDIHYQQR